MSLWLGFLLLPALICMAVLASLTSIVAFSILSLRAVSVYAELASVLLHDLLSRRTTALFSYQHTTDEDIEPSGKVSRRTASTAASKEAISAPKDGEFHALEAYANGSLSRDFEGVGGWRMPHVQDSDVYSRRVHSLHDLTIAGERRQFKTTSGSAMVPMEIVSATQSQARTPKTGPSSRRSSSEEYFGRGAVP